jgi:hypothetical protein
MELESYVSHYFERDYGPFKNICNLRPEERKKIIEREALSTTGLNRSDYGEDFFDFRKLADDLTLRCYEEKFGFSPKCRPFFGVLGDADVVGGLYRNPSKIHIDISIFDESELTFMFPDHFHLVWYYGAKVKNHYAVRTDDFNTPEKRRFLGKMYTYREIQEELDSSGIGEHLKSWRKKNVWHRYLEALIWTDKVVDLHKENDCISVKPESFSSHDGIECIVDYGAIERLNQSR